jgi:putative SOS response-associated peptidase YedK
MTAAELAEWYGVEPPADHAPRYNAAPSQLVPVVGRKAGSARRGLVRMRWGFVPWWAADPAAGPKPINARAETAFASPAFHRSMRDRRCLLPADGFYEWAAGGGAKRPVHFRPAAGPVALAGIWDVWAPPAGGGRLYTCAILTVPANDAVRPTHARMPALLTADQFDRWLDPAATPAALAPLLRPYPHPLAAVAVGPAVNAAWADGPDCLAPAAGVGHPPRA